MPLTPADQISIGRALARLGVAKAFRTTIQFSHRGAAPVTLAARIVQDGNELHYDARGLPCEQRVLTLVVSANQTGFAAAAGDPEPVVPGDTVVTSKYANRTYQVVAPIELDTGGRVYTLQLVERKRLQSGS
jgi:hypothetical protein